tara:strand:- start:91 stop:1656 length:1566 start_codon:yes stop_codon:yes gene_type:complete
LVTTIGRIPFNTQLDWLWAELQGPEKKTWQNFLTNPNLITPQEFAKAFESTYERADGQHLNKRQNYASDVFKAFSNNNLSSLSPNAVTTVNYLTNKGMTLAQAAGVTGNLMAESGFDIDPDAYNPSGGGMGGYGIAQWRGDRQTGLQNYFNRTRPEEEKQMVMPTEKNDFLTMLKKGASGLYNAVTERPEGQLLSGGERFARALDPLVMPELRMGDKITANAIAQRKYEETAGNRNRTINVLKGLAAQGDQVAKQVLASVEARALLPKDAMNIYYREKFAKPDKTATQKTGAQLNEELIAKGLDPIYDPKKPYNVFSTGDIKEVTTSGDKITLNTGKQRENLMLTKGYEATENIYNAYEQSRQNLRTIGLQKTLMQDESFESGFGSNFIMNAQKLFERLGFGNANVSSRENFVATSKQQVLDRLDGSLGVGVSASDVTFMMGMIASLDMSEQGIRDFLMIQERIAEGEKRAFDYTKKYIMEQDAALVADGKEPLGYVANPLIFKRKIIDHIDSLPKLFGEA